MECVLSSGHVSNVSFAFMVEGQPPLPAVARSLNSLTPTYYSTAPTPSVHKAESERTLSTKLVRVVPFSTKKIEALEHQR